jgi:hypothetical protein
MEISLDLVTEAARRRLAAVTPEVAGYIVLLATRALQERLFRVSAASFALSETGEVRAHPEGRMSESEVEAALRDLLASLLSLSPSPSPAVVAVAERAESAGLRALSAELTAALIPINHAAAQRALARLFRETRRARDVVEADVEPPPEQPEAPVLPGVPTTGVAPRADVELDIDVELDTGPPPPAAQREAGPARAAPPLEAASIAPLPATENPLAVTTTAAIAPPPSPELDEPERPVERRAAEAPAEAALPAEAGVALEVDVVGADVRSDLDTLLAGFLAHTRSEAAIRLALRRLVGLEPHLAPAL